MLLMAKKPADKSEKSSDTEQISIRMSVKLLDQLERLGEPFGLKRSQIIHRACEEYVQRRVLERSTEPHR